MKKLPIGIQTFSKIREDNYIYIDKTEDVLNIINTYNYVFLSRPRRFGKSLFLDTLAELFSANKKLFEGLYIYDKWDWSKKYPVIKIDWKGNMRNIEELKQRAFDNLKYNQNILNIECENQTNVVSYFDELIQKTYQKYQMPVVILIDEYDKPILDNLDNLEFAKEAREYIKGFYSIIKGNDRYIKFAFLTGVSKFSKASIFSGLNMLTDISLQEKFGNICGYTQKDIDTVFKPYLDGVDMSRFQEYYDGYNFLKDNIYNPFDVLQFIANDHKFKNYWFETGTPTFLIKLINQNHYFLPRLSNLIVDEKLLNSFDIENLDLEVILYQAGYLTIDWTRERKRGGYEYKLKLPNQEVKISFFDYIITYLIKDENKEIKQDNIYNALYNGDIDLFIQNLKSIFASIPYNNYINNNINIYEGFYASVVYIYLQSLGLEIIGEDVTNRGRIDLTVLIEDKVYIIEFKVIDNEQLTINSEQLEVKNEKLKVKNKGGNSALEQIKEKKYYQKYLLPTTKNQKPKIIYLIGIEFSKKDKNICSSAWEKL